MQKPDALKSGLMASSNKRMNKVKVTALTQVWLQAWSKLYFCVCLAQSNHIAECPETSRAPQSVGLEETHGEAVPFFEKELSGALPWRHCCRR